MLVCHECWQMIEKVRDFCPLPEEGQEKKRSTVHNSLLLPPVYGHLATKETWPFDGSEGTSSALRLTSGARQ